MGNAASDGGEAHSGGSIAYKPKEALYAAYPDMGLFSTRTSKEVERFAQELSRREWAGCDTSFARAALLELRWRTNATSDLKAAKDAHLRLKKAMKAEDPPNASMQDAEGSFAPGTEVWFLKLDRSTDQLLAREWPWRIAPYFLEAIDDPTKMYTYLDDLACSDVRRRGMDTRKELNLAISVIARLAIRGGQAGYLASPGIVPSLENFARSWRDASTGFYGVKYVIDENGTDITTKDLSLTFHMVRYLPHLVEHWPMLVDTLLRLSETPYPQGRIDPGPKRFSDHNNYDVAEILRRAWRQMEPAQRVKSAELIASMLDWCLTHSVTADGEVLDPDSGDSVPDAYYFCAAFLDTVGYFDRRKRFWTHLELGDPQPIQKGMSSRLAKFNPRLSVVADARERLGLQHRPTSVAVL